MRPGRQLPGKQGHASQSTGQQPKDKEVHITVVENSQHAAQEVSCASNRAAWMRFDRLCAPSGGRGKVQPGPEMLAKIARGGAEKTEVFRMWLEQGEDAGAVEQMLERIQALWLPLVLIRNVM